MSNGRKLANLPSLAAGCATVLAVMALAGCAQPLNEPSMSGARDTGTYPNLNNRPGVANSQLSAEETQNAKARLEAAAAANARRSGRVPNDVAYLKWLAANHEADALKKIENAE